PATAFVARFIGGHNVLRCIVDAADGKGARLTGPQGLPIATGVGGLAPHAEVHVAIRSDRMRVRRIARRLRAVGAPDGDSSHAAALVTRVAAIEYQGNTVKLRLEGDGVDDLTVTVSDRMFFTDPVRAGETVAVGFDEADAHMLS
ncbi:MAG: TOBE domain-containing protein, partial [Alphaproteobacteria bacterium]|nr:TOBE domain-containing protein [Alphaproteobacteria bacterium]